MDAVMGRRMLRKRILLLYPDSPDILILGRVARPFRDTVPGGGPPEAAGTDAVPAFPGFTMSLAERAGGRQDVRSTAQESLRRKRHHPAGRLLV